MHPIYHHALPLIECTVSWGFQKMPFRFRHYYGPCPSPPGVCGKLAEPRRPGREVQWSGFLHQQWRRRLRARLSTKTASVALPQSAHATNGIGFITKQTLKKTIIIPWAVHQSLNGRGMYRLHGGCSCSHALAGWLRPPSWQVVGRQTSQTSRERAQSVRSSQTDTWQSKLDRTSGILLQSRQRSAGPEEQEAYQAQA